MRHALTKRSRSLINIAELIGIRDGGRKGVSADIVLGRLVFHAEGTLYTTKHLSLYS